MIAPLVQSSPADTAERTVIGVLSEAWWTPLLLIVAAVAVGLWMLPSLAKWRGRSEQIQKAALAAGHRFQEQDGPGLTRNHFRLLAPDSRSTWIGSNVVTAEPGPAIVHVFDAHRYTEHEVNQRRGRSKTTRRGRGRR